MCAAGALAMIGADLLLAVPAGSWSVGWAAWWCSSSASGRSPRTRCRGRTVPFLCSLAATLLAPLGVLRLASAAAIGLAALVLHVVGELAARGQLGATG